MDERIIIKKLQILQGLAVEESVPIGPWRARTAEHVAPDEYRWLDEWRDVPDKTRWPAGLTVFLESSVKAPDGWDLDRTFLSFSFDTMEGLLSVNGAPWSGLDFGHTRCPTPQTGELEAWPRTPVGAASSRDKAAIRQQIGAGSPSHRAKIGKLGFSAKPLELLIEFDSVPRVRCEPHLAGTFGAFNGGSLIRTSADIEAAYYDFRFAFEAFNAIAEGRRKELLGAAIEDAMVAFTLSASREVILGELAAARALLADRIAEIAPDAEGGRLFLTGHTHIDVAYLWPIKETIRKCGRTFATASWMMQRYPEYRFSCSQPQVYQFTKEHYPSVYEQIKERVAEGRWETTGAMWVECDCNVTSGESIIRQMLHGLRFFREEFGTRPTICWLPDVFGYNAGLPQILVGCGLKSFWTWKLHWQARNPFPYHLFWWQGADGTRILAHIPKLGGGAYNGNPTPEQLAAAWDTYLQKADYDQQLFPFGYGDGGGGVNEEMMQFAKRATAFPGLPACRIGTAEEFFAEVHAADIDLPTWVGELYLETHRATYTTQSRTKRQNRKCELALRGAEVAAVIASRLGVRVDTEPLREAWEKVLLHQFHDILPGSSVPETFEDAARDHAEALQIAARVRKRALEPIVGDADDTLRFAVLNSLSWERDGIVELDIPDVGDDLVGTMRGQQAPVQVVSRDGDRARVIAAAEGVPSVGGALLELEVARPLPSLVTASEQTLENQFFRVQLDDRGQIISLYDKRAEREVIAQDEVANKLQLFQDGPEREAAWNVHETYNKREYAWEGEYTVQAIESGPVRATIRVERTHRNTRLVQDITLYDHKPRIDFRTWVDWQERQTMLKAAFPLAIQTDKASFEVQFGVIERPTHRNTSWDQEKFEVCAQRWADLSEGGYGVSLLNDCKYGHDVLGNVLRLTLLRGPEYPDPHADLGEHEFTYSLLPHEGDWRAGETVRHAWQLNVPLFSIPTDIQREPISFITIDGPAILETLKPADDGDGDILRLYEPHGSRGPVTVELNFPVSEVIACNLVEENEETIPLDDATFSFDIKPFQIRTFRLR